MEDTRPYLAASRVCVVPLRIAQGIQNKILEAMASGIPVVTTSKGNEGINAPVGESIMVEDMPETFASRVVDLIQQEALRAKLARNGRKFVEENHDWEVNLKHFEDILIATRKECQSQLTRL